MEKIDWQKVFSVVDTLLEVEPEYRAKEISSIEIKFPDLAPYIKSHFESVISSEGIWDELLDLNREIFDAKLEDQTQDYVSDIIGEKIGPYKITNIIGKGGMGNVYEAKRSDGEFERVVAIKIMALSLHFSVVKQRFQREKKILARLSHPNIAQLLDAGVTKTGNPYLIMELVKGVPITKYCIDQELTTKDKLDLFLQLCSAVEFAHLNLTIHRDLKPENILVTESGELKVLDFGISKLIDDTLSEDEEITKDHHRIFSLNYASPEQVRFGPVGLSTDIYALGIIMYEILGNKRPFELSTIQRADAFKIIENKEPLSLDKVPEVNIEKDLAAIFAKATRKNIDDRYSSVTELRQDIERYLSDQPVTAKKGTTTYLLSKFYKRNRLKVATACLVLISIIGFSAFYSVNVTRERNLALQAEYQAIETSQFMLDLFNQMDFSAAENPREETKMFLQEAVKLSQTEFDGNPASKARVLRVIGKLQNNYRDPKAAYQTLLEAEEEYFKLENSELNQQLYYELASIYRLQYEALRDLRNDDQAVKTLDKYEAFVKNELIPIQFKLLDENGTRIPLYHESNIAVNRAEIHNFAGDFSKAQSSLDIAFNLLKTQNDTLSTIYVKALNIAGWTNTNLGDYKKGEAFFRKGLKQREDSLISTNNGYSQSQKAISIMSLGWNMYLQGKQDEAVDLLRKSKKLTEKSYGGESSLAMAEVDNRLGVALQSIGNFKESSDLIFSAYNTRKNLLGENHPNTIESVGNMGTSYYYRGDLETAVTWMKKSYELSKDISGEDNPDNVRALTNIAVVLSRSGNNTEAKKYFEQAIDLGEKVYPNGNPMLDRVKDYYKNLN